MSDDFIPVKATAEALAKYEHSNKKKHLIMEFRSDEHEICHPFEIRKKPHWYSAEEVWLAHYKADGEPDIRRL